MEGYGTIPVILFDWRQHCRIGRDNPVLHHKRLRNGRRGHPKGDRRANVNHPPVCAVYERNFFRRPLSQTGVHPPLVTFQAAARRESLATVGAGEGLFSGMDSHMLGEASPLGERPETLLASVRLFSGVRSHVFTKLVAETEPSLAHRARKRFLVGLDVLVENGFACERLAAFRAFVRLLDCVDSSLVK